MSDTETWNPHMVTETRFEYEREHTSVTPASTAPAVGVSGAFTGGGYCAAGVERSPGPLRGAELQLDPVEEELYSFWRKAAGDARGGEYGESDQRIVYLCDVGDYLAGTPNQFRITVVNNHKIGDTLTDVGLYAEDDWKARQNLTVSYGIRYETQNHLPGNQAVAPRLAFSYGLFSGKGAPKTVIRGGFGMFYTRFAQEYVLTTEEENGINTTSYTVANPGTSCNPSAPNLIVACGATSDNQQTYSSSPNLRTPYIIEFAGGADQQVGKNGTISVNYLHTQGVHQFATQNIGYNFADPAASTAQYQFFSEGTFNQNQLIIHGRVQTSKAISLFGYYSLNSAHGDTSGATSDISTPGRHCGGLRTHGV